MGLIFLNRAYIAVLVVWAHALGLRSAQPKKSLWAVKAGRLKLVDLSEPRAIEEGGIGDEDLRGVLMREFSKPGIGAEGIEEISVAAIGMIKMVQKKLEGSAWELCEFLIHCGFKIMLRDVLTETSTRGEACT